MPSPQPWMAAAAVKMPNRLSAFWHAQTFPMRRFPERREACAALAMDTMDTREKGHRQLGGGLSAGWRLRAKRSRAHASAGLRSNRL
jgi:hypothetical protein